LPGKLLLPDEAQSYLGADQALVSNWETTADMMLGGRDAGYRDARAAWASHKNAGGPDNAVVYFSCDFDTTPEQQGPINDYLQACVDCLGVQSVGVYGSFYVCQRVHQWNPAVYLWQTEAWSGGQVFDAIHLYQRNSWGYAWINGCECDINEVRQSDFGQWNLHFDAPAPVPIPAPTPVPIPKAILSQDEARQIMAAATALTDLLNTYVSPVSEGQ